MRIRFRSKALCINNALEERLGVDKAQGALTEDSVI